MIRQSIIIALALGIQFGIQLGSAVAAGPFDGTWTGTIADSRKCKSADVTLTVAGKGATGDANFPVGGSVKIGGKVADDGAFTGKLGKAPMTGKFTADGFVGSFHSNNSNCEGERAITLRRTK